MKNKIFKYDFLIVGAGLIGCLAAIALYQKKYKVLVIEKNTIPPKDHRTLAVNANSRAFLARLGLWDKLKNEEEPIDKIIIKDLINTNNLIFQNSEESMGSVIFNNKLLEICRTYLTKRNILYTGLDFDLLNFKPNSKAIINNQSYFFKKIILSLGKNYENNQNLKKTYFKSRHHAYVGFLKHTKHHQQTAHETFTPKGPLAILPSPNSEKKISTFIYSTDIKMNLNSLSNLIKSNFELSHGQINLHKSFSIFSITPHLSQSINKNLLLIGDTFHSIHPVAGQGWNLGIKDIQELIKCLDQFGIDNDSFDEFYSSKRTIENFGYLTLTSLINHLYEKNSLLSKMFIKSSFHTLNNLPILKRAFIGQAMGKINLI